MPTFTFGKSLFTMLALVLMMAPYLADWSETHVLNPNWPPHARFHNGQTMSTGLFLGLASLYYLYFAPSPAHLQHTHLKFILLLQHCYYVPAMSAILYPGARWTDPEFGEGRPQMYMFPAILSVSWVAYLAERTRLDLQRDRREKAL